MKIAIVSFIYTSLLLFTILEAEVRTNLKEEIKEHTQNWVEGKVYGSIKK